MANKKNEDEKAEVKKENVQKNEKNVEKKQLMELTSHMRKINEFTVDEEKRLNKRIFINLVLAVAILLYFCIINLGYKNIVKDTFILDLQVFSATILTASIVLFEKAYKKQDGKLCIYGIEMLVLAIITLFMPYIYFYSTDSIKIICSCLSIYLSIYYVAKCMIIQRKAKKQHLDNLSDVKEIVKK